MKKFDFRNLPRWLRDFVPLVFWLALIFFLSSQSRLVEIESEIGDKFFFKGAHIATYAVLMWLWWRALSASRQNQWPTLLAALGLTVLYGISDEIHQSYVPGRHAQAADVLFDTSGALLMLLLLRRLKWLRFFPEKLGLSFDEAVPESAQVLRSNNR